MKAKIIRMTLEEARKKDRTDWARVRAMTEEQIEQAALSDPDAQPTDTGFWKDSVVVLPEPKKSVSIRLDPDVVDWFRSEGRGYQTRINAVLRSYMIAQEKGAKTPVARKKAERRKV